MVLACAGEDEFVGRGISVVAGVDEVGCGPLAGPVMAAAVIVPNEPNVRQYLLSQAGDSKVLSAARRQALAQFIHEKCMVAVGVASVAEIDTINIRQAAFLAMTRAVAELPVPVGAVLVDGPWVPTGLTVDVRPMVKGDGVELCIACASIVAKVARDALMVELDREYPGYSWASNAGYGSRAHLAALQELGVTPHHRRSFAPVRALLEMAA